MNNIKVRRCVRGIIFKDGKVLIGKVRSKLTGKPLYKFPGGGIERNETIEKALHAECLEEVGVEIDNVLSLGIRLEYKARYLDKKTKIKYTSIEDNWCLGEYLEENNRYFDIEGDGMEYFWVDKIDVINLIRNNPHSSFKETILKGYKRSIKHIIENELMNKGKNND